MDALPTPPLAEPRSVAARYARILSACEPFVISNASNWEYLELSPFGRFVERMWTPTRTRSRHVIDRLHRLDSFTFGDQDMVMPRWVLFDCGEFPGLVFGFGALARRLSAAVRERYRCVGVEFDETFVPLSMWVAIPCAEPDAWFGHNLSSANVIMPEEERLPGLGTLTKLFGVAVTGARRQYGATQWSSASLRIHMTLGRMEILSAWTPAHTHPATFSYRVEVDADRLDSVLAGGPVAPAEVGGGRSMRFDADDSAAMQSLQAELESGARAWLVAVDRGDPNVVSVVVVPGEGPAL